MNTGRSQPSCAPARAGPSATAPPPALMAPSPRGRPRPAEHPLGALVLGHGAGGGVGARDLVTVTEAALSERFTVALVEQPYRVAGRRSPAPAAQLDRAWTYVVGGLKTGELDSL